MSSKSEDETKHRRKRSVKPSVIKDANGAPEEKAKRGRTAKVVVVAQADDDEEQASKPEKKPRPKATPHQTLTERDQLPKLWIPDKNADTSYCTLLLIPAT